MTNSKIEWTEKTWNPLAGCARVSAGCDNCYAARMALRLEAMAKADIAAGKDPGGKAKYVGVAKKNGRGVPTFTGKINTDEMKLNEPFGWKKPAMVFVNSMSDLFHEAVQFAFIEAVFEVMMKNPQHTFQVLTKRPARAADFYQWVRDNHLRLGDVWPLPNVWLGVSVENQAAADRQIPGLLRIPAAVRFLSIEPLLGAVDLRDYFEKQWISEYEPKPIDWVIVGGESGPNARTMHPDWARGVRDQCNAAGIDFFFKQWGEWLPELQVVWGYDGLQELLDDDKYSCRHLKHTPDDVGQMASRSSHRIYTNGGFNYYRVGKKAAGRLLDGREWSQMPGVSHA